MYVCISSICYIIELYPVGMYQDYLAYVLLSVGGGKSIWTAKYLAQDLNYGLSYWDRDYLISFSYHISSLWKGQLSLHHYFEKNRPKV